MFEADVLCEKNAPHGSWGAVVSEIDNRYRLLSEASWRSFDHHGKRNSKYIKKEFRKMRKSGTCSYISY